MLCVITGFLVRCWKGRNTSLFSRTLPRFVVLCVFRLLWILIFHITICTLNINIAANKPVSPVLSSSTIYPSFSVFYFYFGLLWILHILVLRQCAEKGAFQVVTDNYVKEEEGTGVVHQAPYFGAVSICFSVCVLTQ